MNWLLPAFALLVAAAGWYYAFYSSAATALSGIEDVAANARRVRLRRVNGCLMILLGAVLFVGNSAIDNRWNPVVIAMLLLLVLVLLAAVLFFAALDVRLTRRLRHNLRNARNRDREPK